MATEAEIAWAAGLFEGEGCFDSHTLNAFRPRASMSLTDLDILERFQEIVGVGKIIPSSDRSKKPNWKKSWHWYVDEEGFHVVWNLLGPWLGPRRRAAAESAIEKRAAHVAAATAPRPCARCGSVFRPPFLRSGSRSMYCSQECKRYRPSRPPKEDASLMALTRAVARPNFF